MATRQLKLITFVAIVFVLNAGKTLDVETGHNRLRAGSCSHATNLTDDGWLSYPVQPAKNPAQSLRYLQQSERPMGRLLPVQSKNPDDLAKGKLLVASRDLADPIFAKTVVLLIQYDSNSVVGLMMNKRTKVPLSQVFKELKAAKNRSDLAYAGGPVDLPTVFALVHSKIKPDGAQQIFGEVFLISTKAQFEKNLSASPDPEIFHVYLGYAGWTAEQLRQEIRLGAWFIFQADDEAVFSSSPDSLWSQMIRRTELKMVRTRYPEGKFQRLSAWLIPTGFRVFMSDVH